MEIITKRARGYSKRDYEATYFHKRLNSLLSDIVGSGLSDEKLKEIFNYTEHSDAEGNIKACIVIRTNKKDNTLNK